MDIKAFGLILRNFREAKKLSLETLAAKSRVAKNTIHAIELGRGNPTLNTLAALAGPLGARVDVTLEELANVTPKSPAAEATAKQGPGLTGWMDAARVLTALAQVKPVRRLVVLYLLTKDEAYFDAIRELALPESDQVCRLLKIVP